jgi:hypothetical protein
LWAVSAFGAAKLQAIPAIMPKTCGFGHYCKCAGSVLFWPTGPMSMGSVPVA